MKAREYRIIIAAFVSSFSSLFLFSSVYHEALSVLYKLVISVVTVILAYFPKSFRELLRISVVLFIFSIIYCGAMIAIYQIWNPSKMMIVNDVVYFHVNPLVMIALTAVIYGGSVLFGKLHTSPNNTVVNLRFKVAGKDFTCVGKIDTACSATEPFSGAPVIIAEKSIIDIQGFQNKRVIPYTTINGASMMFGVKAEDVYINEKEIHKQIYIASVDRIGEGFQAIINSEITR